MVYGLLVTGFFQISTTFSRSFCVLEHQHLIPTGLGWCILSRLNFLHNLGIGEKRETVFTQLRSFCKWNFWFCTLHCTRTSHPVLLQMLLQWRSRPHHSPLSGRCDPGSDTSLGSSVVNFPAWRSPSSSTEIYIPSYCFLFIFYFLKVSFVFLSHTGLIYCPFSKLLKTIPSLSFLFPTPLIIKLFQAIYFPLDASSAVAHRLGIKCSPFRFFWDGNPPFWFSP